MGEGEEDFEKFKASCDFGRCFFTSLLANRHESRFVEGMTWAFFSVLAFYY